MNEIMKEALEIYEDLRVLLSDDGSQKYLVEIASKENVLFVLDELEYIFKEAEDYERCYNISEWREIVKNSS
jgi:hypothetical protein